MIETEFEVIRQHIVTRVNGDVKQDGPVFDMLRGVGRWVTLSNPVR